MILLPITVCVITKNEEQHLRDCLESVRGHVDEIVVLDSHSTDRTREIALAFGARFHQQDFQGFASQRNACAALASHEWVFQLDADERIEPEAWAFLQGLFQGGGPRHAAYALPRKSISEDGKFHLWVRYYPVFIDRFYDRRRSHYVREYLERLERGGSRGFIPHHLLHDRPVESEEALDLKLMLYTRLRRITREQSGSPPGFFRRLRAKWANLLFYTAAFSGPLRGFHKGPAYCLFLCRWYAVFLCPPLRAFTLHYSTRGKISLSPTVPIPEKTECTS